MTCKDCIHYDVCVIVEHRTDDEDYYTEYGCKDFKNKSKIIELPYKVGDDVYYPWIYDGTSGIAVTEVESIKIYYERLPIIIVKDWESDMSMPICFTTEDVNNAIFSTFEEAEKALKKLESEVDK